jgi:hypothetical protein
VGPRSQRHVPEVAVQGVQGVLGSARYIEHIYTGSGMCSGWGMYVPLVRIWITLDLGRICRKLLFS